MRARELGVVIGDLPTGPHNAITDVPGVWVGHSQVIADEPAVVRTGVTVIAPREGGIWGNHAFAGFHLFSGNGEMTGLPWIEESGLLGSPIAITSTMQVGIVRDAIVMYADRLGIDDPFQLPVVTETWDGWLSDPSAFPLTAEDVYRALDSASPGAVAEGNVGGGTGMICHEFKGGIGTSSRVVDGPGGRYVVGVLVQANYGLRDELTVKGFPVGRHIGFDAVPSAWDDPEEKGSIIIVAATDAPLIPVQCTRLARRATAGLARVGGIGRNGSGDLFLAFSTGNHLPRPGEELYELTMLPHPQMSDLFRATVDAVEESIINALCAAETMTGHRGRTAHALPLDSLAELVAG